MKFLTKVEFMAKITNTSNITFKYILPDQSEVESSASSNVASIENMTTSLEKVLSSSKTFGLPNDEITIEMICNQIQKSQ